MKPAIPSELVRAMAGDPEIDLAKRTVRSVITTKLLARDGGIVLPEGINVRFYEQNPIVAIRHCMPGHDTPRPLVVGRSLGLARNDVGMASITQFADSELGREWGYLYGLNEAREVYMRAYSFGWAAQETTWWTLSEARNHLGALWDEEAVTATVRQQGEVWVCKRSEMHEYSVVEVGADRAALSRALRVDGIRVAGEILMHMDLNEAMRMASEAKTFQGEMSAKLARLEQDIQALRRDGAAAAARGDSAEVLSEIRSLLAQVKAQNQKERSMV